ncbi:MAG: LysR family transcriptional regulator [Pseudomonadota bacterium]
MEIEALRTVALVAERGSFAAAARVLDLDPSSVSRTVANVEAALGLRLFQRTTRALSITEAGQTYLTRVAPLLDELDHAKDAAQQVVATPSGTLKMTASVAFAHACIVPHLAAFHAAYPKITVELLPTDANVDIAGDGMDFAIRLAPAPQGDLISTRLMRTRYVVVAAPEYLRGHAPIAHPSDLSAHNCLRFALPAFRTRWRFQANGEAPFDVPISGQTIIANALSLRRAAIEGLGPVLLADWLVGEDIGAGRLVNLFPGYTATATEFDTGAWALYQSRAYLPNKTRVMIDFLRTRLG